MKRHKKIFLVIILAMAVLAGSIGGVVLASDEDEEDKATPEFGSFIDRVIEIYQEKTNTTIDKEALRESLEQAREEIRDEQPRLRFHHRFFDDELTQEQRDEIEKWLEDRPEVFSDEFKAWLELKPDVLSDEFKEWLESRPQIASDEFEEWLEKMPEDIPFDLGLHDKLGPRFFGHMNKAGRFMFGCLESDNNA